MTHTTTPPLQTPCDNFHSQECIFTSRYNIYLWKTQYLGGGVLCYPPYNIFDNFHHMQFVDDLYPIATILPSHVYN